MSDPTEDALLAIENKYYPMVVEGKSLMPYYPREDVRLMISAAVASEREACAKIADDVAIESKTASENFRAIGADLDDFRHGHYSTSARQIAAAIRARGTS